MKKIFVILFITLPYFFSAQSLIPRYKTMMDSTDDYTFYDVQIEAENYFANRDKGRGSGYKQYKRWAIFSEERFSPSGNIFNISATNLNNYQAYLNNFNFSTLPSNYDPGYWTPISTGLSNQGQYLSNNSARSSNPGIGRVQCIEIDGTTCYIGTPGGGIWKAVNNDFVDWMPISDGLPQIGIADIEVSPNNSDNIFILTGEGDGSTNLSIGVLESNDGGLTWHSTALTWGVSSLVAATRLLMHPTNPNIQFVSVRTPAAMRGIYKTTDGWDTWTHVHSDATQGEGAQVYDMEFKPGDPSIVYASTHNDFLRSTSSGDSATFTKITTGLTVNPSTERVAIGVSPDNASYVYLLYGGSGTAANSTCNAATSPFFGFYRSTNSGASFTLRSSGCPNLLGYHPQGTDEKEQSSYDLTIAVNPADVDEVHVGGINCWMSPTGGSTGSWVITSWWDQNGNSNISGFSNNTIGYTHADIHVLEFHPTGQALYCGSDGGFYRRMNGNWINRSQGLVNTQFYNLDVHNTGSFAIGGTQDNGGNFINISAGTLSHEIGADGIAAQIDQNDSNNQTWFLSTQSSLARTTNGGTNYDWVFSGNLWRSEVVIHPTNSQIVYLSDDNDLYRSTTGGGSGSFSLVLDFVNWVERIISTTHGVSNSNRLYTTTQGANQNGFVYMSDSGGDPGTWNQTTNPPTVTFHTDITVNPDDSRDVWVTASGYTAGNKIWYSYDKGTTWSNKSGSLPNVPVNCIAVDPNRTDHSVYVGTDVGVFYRDDNLSDWVPFFHGLPNVIVKDLEIANGKLYAGSWGRGLWESNLYGDCFSTITLNSGSPSWSSSYSNLPQYYAASDWIKSERTIYSSIGDSVRYQGGNYVELLPGFNTQSGANFKARIGQCSNNASTPSNYMSAPNAIIYRCYGVLVP